MVLFSSNSNFFDQMPLFEVLSNSDLTIHKVPQSMYWIEMHKLDNQVLKGIQN